MWIFGGRQGKNVPSNGYPIVQVYDPDSDKWTTSDSSDDIKEMPVGRGGTGHAVYNKDTNKFYVFGGETESDDVYATSNHVYNRVDIYDANNNEWSRGTNMTYPRHGIFPVLYNDGVLVASGGLHNAYNTSKYFTKYCL